MFNKFLNKINSTKLIYLANAKTKYHKDIIA